MMEYSGSFMCEEPLSAWRLSPGFEKKAIPKSGAIMHCVTDRVPPYSFTTLDVPFTLRFPLP